jgi:putative copper resistance protein D
MTGITSLLRCIHLGSAMLLWGSFIFALLVAYPADQRDTEENTPIWCSLERFLLRLRWWCLGSFFAAGIVGLYVQMASVTPHSLATLPMVAWSFLPGTHYGRVWLLRLFFAVCLGGVLVLGARQRAARDQQRWWRVGAGLAGVLLAAQAWAGHAAAAEGVALFLQVTVAAVHLLAAGIWLGSLPLLLLLLSWAYRANTASAECLVHEGGNPSPLTNAAETPGKPGEHPAKLAGYMRYAVLAAAATRRFSALALGSVALLVGAGVLNAWVLVGNLPALLGTPYGRLLLGKVSLFLFLLVLGAVNHWHEKPRLLRAVAAQQRRQSRDTLRRLRRNVRFEMALGVAILLLVGWLGSTPPARHISPVWPLSFRLSWQATRDLPSVRFRVVLGVQIGMVGLITLGYGVLRQRRQGGVAVVGILVLGGSLGMIFQAMAVDAYPTTYVRPTVPYQALSIANGLHLYQTHCTVCHGLAGYGDGPAAAALTPRPADLTAAHTADHTVGDLFWWLSHGIKGSAMPGFHDRLNEEERWDVINFLRTLAAAEQARTLGPRLEPEPWLVAPDFTYTTLAGEGQTLKDQRGRNLVLVVFFRLPGSFERLAQLHDLVPTLQGLRVEVLAIPLHGQREATHQLKRFPRLAVVADGATEAAITYTMLRKSLSPVGVLPIPPFPAHVEFLIDRQGYIRARWLPDSSPKWAERQDLLAAIAWLNREKPRAPAPDDHVH